jgi:geranylgeranyl diphosphate synthase type I
MAGAGTGADVMDGDEWRRHRPTSWTVFGESPALLASDALIVLALSMLVREAGARGASAAGVLADAYQQLVVGQLMDIGFQSRTSVTLEECHRMVEGKTAALTSCAAQMGAVLAGADSATVTALGEFGRHLGLAFQFTDDVLGIWGDPTLTGKPVGADIGTRKKSLPVAFALSSPESVGSLTAFYQRSDEPDRDEIEQVTARLEALGARSWAESRADLRYTAACDSLDRAGLAEQSQVALRVLARLAAKRGQVS